MCPRTKIWRIEVRWTWGLYLKETLCEHILIFIAFCEGLTPYICPSVLDTSCIFFSWCKKPLSHPYKTASQILSCLLLSIICESDGFARILEQTGADYRLEPSVPCPLSEIRRIPWFIFQHTAVQNVFLEGFCFLQLLGNRWADISFFARCRKGPCNRVVLGWWSNC